MLVSISMSLTWPAFVTKGWPFFADGVVLWQSGLDNYWLIIGLKDASNYGGGFDLVYFVRIWIGCSVLLIIQLIYILIFRAANASD